jgi:hypothetical protein
MVHCIALFMLMVHHAEGGAFGRKEGAFHSLKNDINAKAPELIQNGTLPDQSLYNSVSFTHLTHTGGSSIRSYISDLCKSQGIVCFESQVHGHGKSLDAKAISRKHIDVVYGHFLFEYDKIMSILRHPVFMFTTITDAWSIAKSSYFHKKSRLPPSEFIRQEYPHGVQHHVRRLSGLQRALSGTIVDEEMCLASIANLKHFDLIVDKQTLRNGGMQSIWTTMYTTFNHQGAVPVVTKGDTNVLSRGRGFNVSEEVQEDFMRKSACHMRLY